MHILIIDNKSDELSRVIRLCSHLNYSYDLVEPVDVSNIQVKQYDLAILTGGIWYDDPTQQREHYDNELQLIIDGTIPVLGICLGMQLIASAFGGELMELKQEHHGERVIELTESGRQVFDWPSHLQVYENHTVGITKVSSQFDVLATSKDCVEIIKHHSLPIIGVQFHPERLTKREFADHVWTSIIHELIKSK